MSAVGIKAPLLGKERWFCFNLRAQIAIARKYGSLPKAVAAFNDAFFRGDPDNSSDGRDLEKTQIVADWCEALTIGGKSFARREHGEDSEPVTADDVLDLCSPHELGDTAAAILAAINAGAARDVEDPEPENAQKKTN